MHAEQDYLAASYHNVDRLLERLGAAAHGLDHDIPADARRGRPQLHFVRFEDIGGSQRTGSRRLVRVAGGDAHAAGPRIVRDERREQPYRTRADDQHSLPAHHSGALHGVKADAAGLRKRRHGPTHPIGDRVDIPGLGREVLAHAAGVAATGQPQTRAELCPAASAECARIADTRREHRHARPRFGASDARAESDDLARQLVARPDSRQVLARPIFVKGMEVAPADAASADAHQHVARPRLGHRDVANPEDVVLNPDRAAAGPRYLLVRSHLSAT